MKQRVTKAEIRKIEREGEREGKNRIYDKIRKHEVTERQRRVRKRARII